MSDGSADIDNTAKIVEELIPESKIRLIKKIKLSILALISKWMNQLSIKDENATGEKLKAITLVLEIIDNFCKTSPKISLQLLKEGIMEIVIKYLPSNFQKDKMSQTGSQHSSDNSELSELEEFKIGNGGQATTSYHTTRKNSLRTKSAEMSQSQISLCNR